MNLGDLETSFVTEEENVDNASLPEATDFIDTLLLWIDYAVNILFPPDHPIVFHPLYLDRLHFSFGLVMLSFVSFLHMLFSSAIVGPIPFGFHHHVRRVDPNVGGNAGQGLQRMARGMGQARDGALVVVILVLAMAVILGMFKAIYMTWNSVQNVVRRVLEHAGQVVMDVNVDEEDTVPPPTESISPR